MLNKIAAMLDALADSLEAKGLIKEAYEVDRVANEVEAFDMQRQLKELFHTIRKNLVEPTPPERVDPAHEEILPPGQFVFRPKSSPRGAERFELEKGLKNLKNGADLIERLKTLTSNSGAHRLELFRDIKPVMDDPVLADKLAMYINDYVQRSSENKPPYSAIEERLKAKNPLTTGEYRAQGNDDYRDW